MLTPATGAVGASVDVDCTGFTSGDTVLVHWDDTLTPEYGSFLVDGLGEGSATITVPAAVNGAHSVIAKEQVSGLEASATFTVTESIAINPTEGQVGASFDVTLAGWASGESVDINWYHADMSFDVLDTVVIDATGGGNATVAVPPTEVGAHDVEAVGTVTTAGVTATFTVDATPVCEVAPTSASVGTTLTVTCTGFDPSMWVTLHIDSATTPQRASFLADATGAGSASFIIPNTVNGAHTVVAVQAGSGLQATAPFTINQSITTTVATGSPGSSLAINLAGWADGETVTLIWHQDATTTVNLGNVTIGANGSAFAAKLVPDAIAGVHTLEAVGSVTTGSATTTFTVVPKVSFFPTSGRVGQNLPITLRGYGPNESVVVTWEQDGTTTTTIGTATTNGVGTGTISFTIPAAARGAHTVTGAATVNTASADFIVVQFVATTTVAGADFASGFVGDTVRVALTGWDASQEVTVRWYDTAGFLPSGPSTIVGTTTVDANGSGFVDFVVPSATRGTHIVEVFHTAATSVKASDQFAVKSSLALNPTTGIDGDTVNVTLKGYDPNDTVELKWYTGLSTFVSLGTRTTDATGSVTTTFVVPSGTANGIHKVEGQGTTAAAKASADFLLDNPPVNQPADCTLDPTSGIAGMQIDVSCVNYDPDEVVTIYWDDNTTTAIGTFTADATGAGSATVTVPVDATVGPHNVLTEGAGGTESTTDPFEVLVGPSCTLAPVSGQVGATVTVTCTGFQPDEPVDVHWDTTTTPALGTFNADATGAGSTTITVPTATGGAHNVITVGATSGWQVTDVFTVTGTMTVNSTTGGPGTLLTVNVSGFGPSEQIKFEFVNSTGGIVPITTVTAFANGTRTVLFAVPQAPGGEYDIRATGLTFGQILEAPYTITPTFTHPQTLGSPGNFVTLTFKAYQANETISVTFVHGFGEADEVIATAVANAAGTAVITVIIPPSGRGFHDIKGVGNNGTTTQSRYEVIPKQVVNRYFGPVGMSITMTLDGWARNTLLTVRWYETTLTSSPSVVLGTVTTDNFGHATFNWAVPETFAGSHRLEAMGGGNVRHVFFYVQTSMNLSTFYGAPGTSFDVSLRGFGASEQVEIRWYTNATDFIVLDTVTSSALGSVDATYVLPSGTRGSHKIRAIGLTSGVSAQRWIYLAS